VGPGGGGGRVPWGGGVHQRPEVRRACLRGDVDLNVDPRDASTGGRWSGLDATSGDTPLFPNAPLARGACRSWTPRRHSAIPRAMAPVASGWGIEAVVLRGTFANRRTAPVDLATWSCDPEGRGRSRVPRWLTWRTSSSFRYWRCPRVSVTNPTNAKPCRGSATGSPLPPRGDGAMSGLVWFAKGNDFGWRA